MQAEAKLILATLISAALLTGCNGSSDSSSDTVTDSGLDSRLNDIMEDNHLIGDPLEDIIVPQIDSQIAQLGKKLFNTKSLGGLGDTACVSCHHPMLGGGDDLALGIGVSSVNPEVLGPGRQFAKLDSDGYVIVDTDSNAEVDTYAPPPVPRNAPSVFNLALWKKTFFWDGRVQVLNVDEVEKGALPIIATPDSADGTGDQKADLNAGDHLAIAQSKFPIVARAEMSGKYEDDADEYLEDEELYYERDDEGNIITEENDDGDIVPVELSGPAKATLLRNTKRDGLSSRLCGNKADFDKNLHRDGTEILPDGYMGWKAEFQNVFHTSDYDTDIIINQDTVALALATFERSMTFIDNPWFAYLNGDKDAITEDQKKGAELFYTPRSEGGAGCGSCHSGYMLSDEEHHADGFPQIGHGKGNGVPYTTNGVANYDDYGRENVTKDIDDRYKFRTPLLLNVEVTGPYGHSGALATLEEVVRWSLYPREMVDDYFDNTRWCEMELMKDVDDCENLYAEGKAFTLSAISQREYNEMALGIPEAPQLTDEQIDQIVEFLKALTDPCVKDRECMLPWIYVEGEREPDDNMLYGVDADGNIL